MKKPLWVIFNDEAYAPIYRQHFTPSWQRFNGGDFELQVCSVGDRGAPGAPGAPGAFGDFGSLKFNESYRRQMRAMHATIAANIGRVVVWSDTDLRFYAPILPGIEEKIAGRGADIWTSRDGHTHCTGFLFFLANFKVLRFFEDWIDLSYTRDWPHEQVSFNALIGEHRSKRGVRVAGLGEEYWNIGFDEAIPKPWVAGSPVPASPAGMLLHHGNYTMGIPNKLALLLTVAQARAGGSVFIG